MKTGEKRCRLAVLLTLAIVAASCERIDRNYDALPRRSEVYDTNRLPPKEFNGPVYIADGADLLICGISAPDGYDWRIDSAIGISSQCRLVLYRNMVEELALKTGYDERISTDPDTHHLVDGHLYTEFSTPDSTIIKRDGVFRTGFKGREYLLGLLEKDGSLFTLSKDRGGTFISYRKDGVPILQIKGATAFGSFEDASFPRNGALMDFDGSVCFSYHISYGGMETNHVVRDGIDSQLDATVFPEKLDDIKFFRGEIWAVGPRNSKKNSYGLFTPRGCRKEFEFKFNLSERRIYCGEADYPYVYVRRHYGGGSPLDCAMMKDGAVIENWPFGEYHIFRQNGKNYAVEIVNEDHCIIPRGCVDIFNGTLFCAMTPLGEGLKPYVLIGDQKWDVKELNGYLTGLEICVSPPR